MSAARRRCPLWVISGRAALEPRCLLYPRTRTLRSPNQSLIWTRRCLFILAKRTWVSATGMPALCLATLDTCLDDAIVDRTALVPDGRTAKAGRRGGFYDQSARSEENTHEL